MLRWLKGRGAGAAAVAQVQARIVPELWAQVLHAHPFLSVLDPAERDQLQARAAWLLASKNLNGARGLELSDFMRLSIAAQAALPILNLPPALYEGWDEIIVYPEGFSIPRVRQDDMGIVHEYDEAAAGEAWDGGPVILSWADALPNGTAFNVVIHEFAHKLDLRSGHADGMPDLGAHAGLAPRTWRRVLDDSLDRFIAALDAVEAAIPPDVDPESDAAGAWYGQLPLDPYAATDEAEFFAVSSEHFFVDPAPLAQTLPEWYALLQAYYRQDPLARQERPMGQVRA
ncbi:zinc-dependent peptidase [Bordetella sp. BOR01]|uniref:M90 family metallopeptidase n=1 Tax=Bordetella sp. BOR01 TaxID=2854779 RepID=UPI001C474295|nr:M90 family metallopeptidase [Bordetella sp. BOR01]MBV7481940.1 zinc-dependent peptidase [Bordetella sp. BOR01]